MIHGQSTVNRVSADNLKKIATHLFGRNVPVGDFQSSPLFVT